MIPCTCKSKFKKITHVIFDFDGTLVDSEGIYEIAISEIAEEYGKKFTKEIGNKLIGSVELETSRIAVEEMGLPITKEEFLAKFREKTDKLIVDVKLMPGAEKIVKHLHANKIPIAIATSSGQDVYDLKISKHKELFALFNHVVCGNTDPEVKHSKPWPDVFLICAARFPCKPKPEECLVFEDSPNGLKGALRAGMQVIMIPNESVPYEIWKTATLRLDSFEDMVYSAFGLPNMTKEE